MRVFIDANREGYEPSQVYETMTVAELQEILANVEYDHGPDVKVYLRHDGGYTFGGITSDCIEVEEDE